MMEGKKSISQNQKGVFLYCLLFISSCFISLFFISPVFAASLSISPATGSFSTQNNFIASVEVNTSQAINGVEGIVQFPADKLEVVGIDKTQSVMSLWIQEPTFSNGGETGLVHFSAVQLNPGYVGQKGNVLNIIFRVKSAGVANVRFSSGSILANDGKGSNLLDLFNSAVYSLKQSAVTLPVTGEGGVVGSTTTAILTLPPVPLVKVLLQDENGKDVIFNSSEADPKWSKTPYAKLAWEVPDGVTGIITLLDDSPNTELGTESGDLPDFKILPFLKEGANYFHIRFINQEGAGPILHLPLFVDLHEPKNFSITFADIESQFGGLFSTSNPQPRVAVFTEDQMSGLDRYEVKVNSNNWAVVQLERNGTFILPKLSPEERHSVIVRAFDLAGNFVDTSIVIVVEPIVSPLITFYQRNIDSSSGPIIVEGRSAPQAKVEVVLEKNNPILVSTRADHDGSWSILYSNILPAGTYSVRARQVLDNGAESLFSSAVFIRIDSLLGKLLEKLQSTNWYMWFIAFIIIQIISLWYYRRSLNNFKMRTSQRLDAVTGSMEQGLMDLKKKTAENPSPESVKKGIGELQEKITKSKRKIKNKIDPGNL